MSASSPEALDRLRELGRDYFRNGDMTADRSEIVKATFEAYPLTDTEREQLRGWGVEVTW